MKSSSCRCLVLNPGSRLAQDHRTFLSPEGSSKRPALHGGLGRCVEGSFYLTPQTTLDARELTPFLLVNKPFFFLDGLEITLMSYPSHSRPLTNLGRPIHSPAPLRSPRLASCRGAERLLLPPGPTSAPRDPGFQPRAAQVRPRPRRRRAQRAGGLVNPHGGSGIDSSVAGGGGLVAWCWACGTGLVGLGLLRCLGCLDEICIPSSPTWHPTGSLQEKVEVCWR